MALVEQRCRREFERAWARLAHDTLEWQIRRIVFAAATLGIPIEEVDQAAILWAHFSADRRFEPRPVIRRDGRFRMPQPPVYKPRKRAANSSTNGAS